MTRLVTLRRFLLAATTVAALMLLVPSSAFGASVVNGNFETGNLDGWSVVNSGFTPSGWFAYTGTTSPVSGFTVPAPPQGSFAAITDQLGGASHILYQDIALEPAASHTLTFVLYYANRAAGGFSTPASLSETVIPNQQYRVDIMKPSAPVASVAGGDVLANVFQTEVGDPLTLGPTPMTVDLTPFAGQTVRLRFAEVDNQYFFQAAVDDVKIVSMIHVAIDIKPGASVNPVNLGSRGTLPVAILSSMTFDASTVDPLTVTLAGAPVRLNGQGEPMAALEDVNGDGLLDLVLHIQTSALNLTSSATQATLTGTTGSGLPVTGTDSVKIVPSK